MLAFTPVPWSLGDIKWLGLFCLIISENAWVSPCLFSISIASAKDQLFAQSETAQNYLSIDEALSRLLFMTQKRTNNRVFYYIFNK